MHDIMNEIDAILNSRNSISLEEMLNESEMQIQSLMKVLANQSTQGMVNNLLKTCAWLSNGDLRVLKYALYHDCIDSVMSIVYRHLAKEKKRRRNIQMRMK